MATRSEVARGTAVAIGPEATAVPAVAVERDVVMGQEVATETGVTEGTGETSGLKASLEPKRERLALSARGSTCQSPTL